MLKKRLLCFLTAFSIILSACIIPSYADDNEENDKPADKYYNKAKIVTDALVNETVIDGEEETEVTRAQFVHAVVKLFNLVYTSNSEMTYLDVDESNEYFMDINTARQMGWIAPVDTFNPNDQIKLNEALKILLSAAGYAPLAINSGGYPQGYIQQASRIDLLDKLSMAESLNVSDAYKMLYNLLEANVLREERKFGGISYSTGNDTYMYSIYDAYMFDGIITGTSYSGLTPDYSISDNMIEINGDILTYQTTGLDMLGKSVEVLCRDDDERTVIALIDDKNEEIEFEFDDIKNIENGKVSYYTSSYASKTLRLEDGCDIIYNGRKCDALTETMTEGDGFIKFLDNDDDGKYEVVFITKYMYGVVSSASVYDETVGIKTSGNSHMIMDFADSERHYFIKKSDGSDGGFSDLKKDTVIRIALSEDMYLCNIEICDKSVSGKIESLDASNRQMKIDGTEYKISDYFMENEIQRAVAGQDISVYVSNDGKYIISKCGSTTDYKYGYIIKLYWHESGDRLFAKMFNDKGDIEELEVKSRGSLNGSTTKKFDKQLLDELGERPEQLVRYRLNNEGLISAVDTAADVTESTFGAGSNLPEDNSLTKYFSGTMQFKEGVRGFAPYFSVEKALIFKIPPDKSNREDYKILSYSDLGDDVNYPVSGYDLDENGYAAAVVVVTDDYVAQPTKDTPSYVIEDVSVGINDDDEEILWVDCWYGGTYKKLFVDPSKVNVEKASGEPLGTGDIVRIVIKNDEEIVSMSIDFDAAAFVPEKPGIFNIGNAELMYQAGKIYSVGANQMYISSVKDGYDNYDFSYQNLRLYSIAAAGNNIVLVNRRGRLVRPIKADEIQSYVGYGDEGYYAVIRQFAFFPRIVVLYEE